ncbi:Ger(x)C family spore germination protein [Paenibacillus sp. NFR01]|uniref:Ger(x)C family spore germination protein n=1 Tax=Paenibacillus sp. NFR01 TaxID=1566279 RepID=UPI0008B77082|nr:Ger(x)C family spore germination protein [Paenibacillus sp. NFR01]SET27672.1 spore germination protein KC [Paenibacillus sp. NFR01]
MRHASLLLLTFMMSILLCSCWSEREINELAIVTAAGLDRTESGKIRLTLLLAVPRLFGTGSAQGGGEAKLESSAGWVVSEEGDTIMDITRMLQKKLPRVITYSHCRVLIIGDSLARDGITRVLDFFERFRQSQLISYIAVSKTSALDILNFKPKFEKLTSEVLRSEMGQNLTPSIRLIDFLNYLMSEGIEPYAPVVEIVNSQDEGKKSSSNLAIKGIAIFKKDRMVGALNDKETRGVLWVKNQVNKGIITIEIPGSHKKGKVSSELERVNVSRKVSLHGDKVEVTLTVRISENIYENTSDLNLDNEDNVKMIQTQVENAVKERIEDSGKIVQSAYKSDIYGFGQSVYRRYPKAWNNGLGKRWEEIFPEIKPSIIVRGRIIRSGLTNHVIMPRSEQD